MLAEAAPASPIPHSPQPLLPQPPTPMPATMSSGTSAHKAWRTLRADMHKGIAHCIGWSKFESLLMAEGSPVITFISDHQSIIMWALASVAYVSIAAAIITSHTKDLFWVPYGLSSALPAVVFAIVFLMQYNSTLAGTTKTTTAAAAVATPGTAQTIELSRPLVAMAAACILWSIGEFFGGHVGILLRDSAILISTGAYYFMPTMWTAIHAPKVYIFPPMAGNEEYGSLAPTQSAPETHMRAQVARAATLSSPDTLGDTDTRELKIFLVVYAVVAPILMVILPNTTPGHWGRTLLYAIHFAAAICSFQTSVRLRADSTMAILHLLGAFACLGAVSLEMTTDLTGSVLASASAWVLRMHGLVLSFLPALHIGRIISGGTVKPATP